MSRCGLGMAGKSGKAAAGGAGGSRENTEPVEKRDGHSQLREFGFQSSPHPAEALRLHQPPRNPLKSAERVEKREKIGILTREGWNCVGRRINPFLPASLLLITALPQNTSGFGLKRSFSCSNIELLQRPERGEKALIGQA